MTRTEKPSTLSPRRRRYWLSLGIAAAIGLMFGFGAGYTSDAPDLWSELTSAGPLESIVALVMSLVWLAGMTISLWVYHRAIDDHEERAILWASTASWYFLMFAGPVWWLLGRASLLPPVNGIVLLFAALVLNALVWLWLKFR